MSQNNLERFYGVHRDDYARALGEIRSGRKETHWMWYIFPQIQGLGRSYAARYYALEDLDEARAFLEDGYLGDHLQEISQQLLACETDDAEEIFGYIDAVKLRSSMTLFYRAMECDEESVFCHVLEKFFHGEEDELTLDILKEQGIL